MTSCEPINSPILESVRTGRRSNRAELLARWQTGVETLSGYAFQKLRLELAPSVSDAFTMSNSVGAKI
jgi:hypothetical protein